VTSAHHRDEPYSCFIIQMQTKLTAAVRNIRPGFVVILLAFASEGCGQYCYNIPNLIMYFCIGDRCFVQQFDAFVNFSRLTP